MALDLAKADRNTSICPFSITTISLPLPARSWASWERLALWLLFALLILRGYLDRPAGAEPDFPPALAAGLISLIAVQTILNLCVVTNLLPSTGIALPFFSYGGTALAVNLGEMGIVLNISRRKNHSGGKIR